MIGHFVESGHPIFRGLGTFNRGILKKKGGRSTIFLTIQSRKLSSISTGQYRVGVKN